MNSDEEHLRLLSVFHYVVGGLAALFACLPILHLGLGLALLFAPGSFHGQGGPPPRFVAFLLIGIALAVILLGWLFALCLILAGRFLGRRRHYLYCLVMGGISCLFMPFGTFLGVVTLIVLLGPSVQARFEDAAWGLHPAGQAPL
ncbi:MAG: hypothetical protein V1918_04935 [Planctomycetota bacterium]